MDVGQEKGKFRLRVQKSEGKKAGYKACSVAYILNNCEDLSSGFQYP